MTFTENKPASVDGMRRDVRADIGMQARIFAEYLKTLEKREEELRMMPVEVVYV